MTLFTTLAALLLASPVLALPAASPQEDTSSLTSDESTALTYVPGSASIACGALKKLYPTQLSYPAEASYTYEAVNQYWSGTTIKSPACVFIPTNADQVSTGVKTFKLTRSKFAVRGGGHMPIPGYNAIDSDGVLMSMANLTTLAISKDQSYLSVGPGHRWEAVYTYLKQFGRIVVGGRVGNVGVPGLLLGGGISYYSGQYGFGADNVVKYQAVLANGNIVEATANNQYSDLFWALKGGGNSLAIVTRFDLRTFVSPQIWMGVGQYNESQAEAYQNALFKFGQQLDAPKSEPKAAVIPTILTTPAAKKTVYTVIKVWDSPVDDGTALNDFKALSPVADSWALGHLSDSAVTKQARTTRGLQQDFRVFPAPISRDAIKLIHDSFLEKVNGQLSDVASVSASITFQPISSNFLQQGAKNGGNPQGLSAKDGSMFWICENFTWKESSDNQRMFDFANKFTADITALLKSKKLSTKNQYLYMNDAGAGQKIFQNYPSANLQKLKTIRSKYDPQKVFTNLLPGGWKITDA